MTTRYTDAWARTATEWYGDYDRFTVSGPTDPAHGDKSEAPPPLMMDAPILQSGGEIITDVVWEQFEHLPPSIVIDETPVQGQGTPEASGHGVGGLTTPGADIIDLAARRGDGYGADKRATRTTPVYRFFNETFFGYFTRGFEPPPITHGAVSPVYIRGINGFPANDGDGGRPTSWTVEAESWHRGEYESSNVQRDFTPPNRVHGQVKMVEPDIVTIIGDVQPPEQSDVYATPFSTLQRFLPTRRRVRGIRRDPGPWDEDLMAMESGGVIYPGSADGMVGQ